MKKVAMTREEEEAYLKETHAVVHHNIDEYQREVTRMSADIDEMLAHFHDDNKEVLLLLNNTITLNEHMKKALLRNEHALKKAYFGRIDYFDEDSQTEESLYIGRGGISRDKTNWAVVDWRAPVANAYYENGIGKCSYPSPDGKQIPIELKLKRTYEIEGEQLLDFYDSETIANDELLTKYLAKNKQVVLGEIIATIQKEQNEIIRKSPHQNIIVQGVAGSGKTTVAMHRISYILYNYENVFRPEDFYIIGSNRILLNYITGVLPDLDVYGVKQMTMEELFTRLLYEEWHEGDYKIVSTGQKGSIKGTSKWYRELSEYCKILEWRTIPREEIVLNKKQFVEGFYNGTAGVHDITEGKPVSPKDLVMLLTQEDIEKYIRETPNVSMQSKIEMLNKRTMVKIKNELLGKHVAYVESEKKAIRKAFHSKFGGVYKKSVYDIYREFLMKQKAAGAEIEIPDKNLDVYDLAALAFIYKRIKETDPIREAHHIVIDEAQDFGMMVYSVLKYCIPGCTYTIMGDVSQNIHFGFGLTDWKELQKLILTGDYDSFGVLKKSYRNTVEISEFATNILKHGSFAIYPVEPIIRHGDAVLLEECSNFDAIIQKSAKLIKEWQKKELTTIAVICRNTKEVEKTTQELSKHVEVLENDPERAVFGNGVMVLTVEYTKGLEFDCVLILNPTREDYPTDDGHARLLYVAATRALHELAVLHCGDLTGLIKDPVPEGKIQPEIDIKQVTKARKLTVPQPVERVLLKAEVKPQQKMIFRSDTQQTRSQQTTSQQTSKPQSAEPEKPQPVVEIEEHFGDMPATEKLRIPGHAKIDLSCKWVDKMTDGLYFPSRYGILRLSPIADGIVRVTFARGQKLTDSVNNKIKLRTIDKFWTYRDRGATVELQTDEVGIILDKANGFLTYKNPYREVVLTERTLESRMIETTPTGLTQIRQFFNLQKNENFYCIGDEGTDNLKLKGNACFISHKKDKKLPFLLSDKGYGILLATDHRAFYCDVAAYGSYLYTEQEQQLDFYFITGENQKQIMSRYNSLV